MQGEVERRIVSQLLTLYITPVFYIYMERLQAWWHRKFGRKTKDRLEAEPFSEGEHLEPAIAERGR
ncbi:MAG: hypothetical protein EOP84_31170 [Verrucomicrobiaceae bacterium]|nr:MAG: hypothetical protein EOP84_31170 [Verrucomicrobiaceae bacterium]